MRIDKLELCNFRMFTQKTFDFGRPQNGAADEGSFHVLIGENGSGKTTVLDALAIALGVWLIETPDSILVGSGRMLAASDKRLELVRLSDRDVFQETSGDLSVRAFGSIGSRKSLEWEQHIRYGKKRVNITHCKSAVEIIKEEYELSRSNQRILPIIAYYGAGRAWLNRHERNQTKAKSTGPARRWDVFVNCLNERLNFVQLSNWFQREAIAKGNRGGTNRPGFEAVRLAVLRSIPGADEIWYDGDRQEPVLSIEGRAQPFSNLSAGQKMMAALSADLAVKAVTQNGFLLPPDVLQEAGRPLTRVLAQTPGVVLIDELDVHLHPKWQRDVVDNLRGLFPKVQFICTTHSPFIVQSLRSEELINLQGQSVPELGNQGVGAIAQGLMGVDRPDVSKRYEEMVGVAKNYLLTLEEAAMSPQDKLRDFENKLAAQIAPYADNPAFQAFLELKRAAKLGVNSAANGGHFNKQGQV